MGKRPLYLHSIDFRWFPSTDCLAYSDFLLELVKIRRNGRRVVRNSHWKPDLLCLALLKSPTTLFEGNLFDCMVDVVFYYNHNLIRRIVSRIDRLTDRDDKENVAISSLHLVNCCIANGNDRGRMSGILEYTLTAWTVPLIERHVTVLCQNIGIIIVTIELNPSIKQLNR
jgi:hypothetical protein